MSNSSLGLFEVGLTRTSGLCCLTLASTSSISVREFVSRKSSTMALNILTLAVVDVNDSVPIAQSLDEAADEALGALGCGVDANQVEGTFRSRHSDEIRRIINYKNAIIAGISFFLFSKLTSAALATSPHCGMLPLRLIQRRARHTPLSVSRSPYYIWGFCYNLLVSPLYSPINTTMSKIASTFSRKNPQIDARFLTDNK